ESQVHPHRGKTGRQSLRLGSGGDSTAVLALPAAAAKDTVLSLHAERWTKREPFGFRIDAKSGEDWNEIENADESARVGTFTQLKINLPEGAREVRFRTTGGADSGVLLDDVEIQRAGPATASSVETLQPVLPAFIRQSFNPIIG